MSWINPKSVAAIVVAALLAGTAGYLLQKQKTDRLQAQIDGSLAELQKAKADAQAAQDSLAAQEQELQKLHADTAELARTRNRVVQLQQQRDAAVKAAATATAAKAGGKPAGPTAFPPGTYMTRDQFAFAGYATPEATIQSLGWAAINGQSNIVDHLIPAGFPQAQQLTEGLRGSLQAAGPMIQGGQVTEEKMLADDRVEVVVKIDSAAVPGGNTNLPPPFTVMSLMRVDGEWKVAGEPQDYSADWEKTGQITTFAR